MSERRSVGLLGASGHVGRAITAGLGVDCELTRYVRAPDSVGTFTRSDSVDGPVLSISALGTVQHHTLVNCIGVGDPARVAADPSGAYKVTARSDEIVLGYLSENPSCRLINCSSGAAYCSEFDSPASDTTSAEIAVNSIHPSQHYGLAKMASEGLHRALPDLAIIDLRLFSFFSRHIDLSTGYLMCDVVRSIQEGTTLKVGPLDQVRDYVAPRDLCSLISACMDSKRMNAALDVYSAAPVSKFELLEEFRDRFALAYIVDDSRSKAAPTGSKPAYFSVSREAGKIGYSPARSSLETLIEEADAILGIAE